MNNQTRSVYDCVKPLSQRAIKETSLKLREVSISMSKLSVSLLQWHRQCNDLLIALSTSESIRLPVHVQLVSLLQWHLSSMRWSTRSHRSTHQWTWSYVHVQLVSLLQWRAQSRSLRWASQSVSLLQWYCQCNDLSSHRSTHQWIDSPTRSCATSEPDSMTSILNAMIYSLSSLYSPVNLIIRSHATSESATMTSSKSISSMSKLISESASMTSVNSQPLRWASRFFPT